MSKLLSSLLFAGCVLASPVSQADDGGAILGALIGSVAGAAIGHNMGGRDSTAVGAAIGGITGAAIGSDMDRNGDRRVVRQTVVAAPVYQAPPQPVYRAAPQPVYQPAPVYRPAYQPLPVYQAPPVTRVEYVYPQPVIYRPMHHHHGDWHEREYRDYRGYDRDYDRGYDRGHWGR